MILFVDDGKWKVVNLTHINDFMIAMTTFLKADKSTRGVGLGRWCRNYSQNLLNPENPFSLITFHSTFQLEPTCPLIPVLPVIFLQNNFKVITQVKQLCAQFDGTSMLAEIALNSSITERHKIINCYIGVKQTDWL